MSIKTFNSYAKSAESARDEILGVGAFKDSFPERLIKKFNLFFEEFFDGDVSKWESKKEPYIFYKHIMRQYLHEHLKTEQKCIKFERDVIGVNTKRINHSLKKDPKYMPLNKREIKTINLILNTRDRIIKTIVERLKQGYSHDDIARHCMVSKAAILKILQEKEVSDYILAQVEKELITKQWEQTDHS